jgi:hypothetical protein
VCKSDDFTRRLMGVFEASRVEAARDDAVLAILRSDYMLDEPTGSLLQVSSHTRGGTPCLASSPTSRQQNSCTD